MEKNQKLFELSICTIVILAGVTFIWIEAGWTGNRAVNSTFLAILFLGSFAFNAGALVAKHGNEKFLSEIRNQQRFANWLLRLSIEADESGVKKALNVRARELQAAYDKEASFQVQRLTSDQELTIAWFEAKSAVESEKKTFWSMVDLAKQSGLEVPEKVSFRDFVIDQDGAAT